MRVWMLSLLLLAACGEPATHPYPETARAAFNRSCPAGDPRCDCSWEAITRAMTYEEYQAAMDRFAKDGIMDHRMTAARADCVDAK